MSGVCIRGQPREDRRLAFEDGGRDWGDAIQAKECQSLPAPARMKRRQGGCCPGVKEAQPCSHFAFGVLASRTLRDYISVVSGYTMQHAVILLQQL